MKFINLKSVEARIEISKIFDERLKKVYDQETLNDILEAAVCPLCDFKHAFIDFMIVRFADEYGSMQPMAESYIAEWADRFMRLTAYEYSDKASKIILDGQGLTKIFKRT